jgi:hypothetical protein
MNLYVFLQWELLLGLMDTEEEQTLVPLLVLQLE